MSLVAPLKPSRLHHPSLPPLPSRPSTKEVRAIDSRRNETGSGSKSACGRAKPVRSPNGSSVNDIGSIFAIRWIKSNTFQSRIGPNTIRIREAEYDSDNKT